MDVETFESQGAVILCHTVSSQKKNNSLVSLATFASSLFLVFFGNRGFWPSSKMSLKMDL